MVSKIRKSRRNTKNRMKSNLDSSMSKEAFCVSQKLTRNAPYTISVHQVDKNLKRPMPHIQPVFIRPLVQWAEIKLFDVAVCFMPKLQCTLCVSLKLTQSVFIRLVDTMGRYKAISGCLVFVTPHINNV